MIVRDNRGQIVAELQHLRDDRGNTVDTNTTYYGGRPVTQVIHTRDNEGHFQTRTILGGRLLP